MDTWATTSQFSHYQLTIAFSGESSVSIKFNPGTTFTDSEVTVKNLDGLAELLLSLEAESTKTIIRWKSISDATGVVNRNKDKFRPAKRQWCMIDIDSLFGIAFFYLNRSVEIDVWEWVDERKPKFTNGQVYSGPNCTKYPCHWCPIETLRKKIITKLGSIRSRVVI